MTAFPDERRWWSRTLLRLLAEGCPAVLLLTGHASVARLALSGAVYGAAEAFFRPAVLGLVPQLVPVGELQSANALLSLSSNASLVLGPEVAGVLVAVLGPGAALGIDAATFGVSALTLLLLQAPPLVAKVSAGLMREVVVGFREVTSRSWVWATLLAFSAYHALVLPALLVPGPLYAVQHRGGAGSWGLISAGSASGRSPGRSWRCGGDRPVKACWSAGRWRWPARRLPRSGALAHLVVAALEAGTGVCVSLCVTVWETALGERILADAQSRVSSFDYLASLLLMPVGYVLVGPVAHAVGTRVTGVTASLVTATVCLAVAGSAGLRAMRRLVA